MEVCSNSSHLVCIQSQLIHLPLFLKVVYGQALLVSEWGLHLFYACLQVLQSI